MKKKRTMISYLQSVSLLTAFGLLGAPVSALSNGQSEDIPSYIWSNSEGLVSVKECQLTPIEAVPFFIVQNSSRRDPGYEALRTFNGGIRHYIENKSLVMTNLAPFSEKKGFNNVRVLGYSQNSGVHRTRYFADRNDFGFMPLSSQHQLSNYVIELKAGAPDFRFEPGSIPLEGSFWQSAALEGGDYSALFCGSDETPYVIFNVYTAQYVHPIAQVGVSPLETNVFRSIQGLTLSEADQRIERVALAGDYAYSRNHVEDDSQNTLAGSSTSLPRDGEAARTQPSYSRFNISENSLGEVEIDEAGNYELTEDEIEELNRAYEAEIEEAEAAEAFVDGPLNYMICSSSARVNVRDDDLKQLFQANRFTSVRLAQGWSNNRQRGVVGGRSYDFVRIAISETNEAGFEVDRIGWIAEEMIKPESHCAEYQRSLGAQRPVVCSASASTVNVRNETLNSTLFAANHNEPVALRADWEEAMKTQAVGNREFNFVPVVFLNRNAREGWMASEFIQTQEECDKIAPSPQKLASRITGLDDPNCCLYPFARQTRRNWSYASGMRAFAARRGGGSRAHAGADIYMPTNTPILAVAPGRVFEAPRYFYAGTWQVSVQHTGGFVVRYGEVSPNIPNGVRRGAQITAGQTIARVGNLRGIRVPSNMLHFELYSGRSNAGMGSSARNYLHVPNRNFQRRTDLMNPTPHLIRWEIRKFGNTVTR